MLLNKSERLECSVDQIWTVAPLSTFSYVVSVYLILILILRLSEFSDSSRLQFVSYPRRNQAKRCSQQFSAPDCTLTRTRNERENRDEMRGKQRSFLAISTLFLSQSAAQKQQEIGKARKRHQDLKLLFTRISPSLLLLLLCSIEKICLIPLLSLKFFFLAFNFPPYLLPRLFSLFPPSPNPFLLYLAMIILWIIAAFQLHSVQRTCVTGHSDVQ